jgi:hypothetical protein
LSLAPTRPRSCELSPGHALGPSARRAGVCPRPRPEDPLLNTVRVRHRSGHPHPVATSRRRSRRAPYRSGMADRIPHAPPKSTPQEQSPTTIFSENQKFGGLVIESLTQSYSFHCVRVRRRSAKNQFTHAAAPRCKEGGEVEELIRQLEVLAGE